MSNPFDRLVSAMSRRKKDRILAPVILKGQKEIGKIFKQEGDLFIEFFSLFRGRFKESVGGDEIDRIFNQIEQQINESWMSTMDSIYEQSLFVGASQLNTVLGDDLISFNLKNDRAYQWAVNNSSRLITQVNETTRFQIKQIILKGIDEGDSYDRIARSITKKFKEFAIGKPQEHIDSRAHLVAVTETANAYEYGALEGAMQAQAAGLAIEKYWSNSGDSRVSEGCQQNTFQGWIGLETSFLSGHSNPPRFPGCRCASLYRRKQ